MLLGTCLGSARHLDKKNADRYQYELMGLEQEYRGLWDNLEHAAKLFADDGYDLARYDEIVKAVTFRFTPHRTTNRVTAGSVLAFLLGGDLLVPMIRISWPDLERAGEALAFLDSLP